MEELPVGVFLLQEICLMIYLREEQWTTWEKLSLRFVCDNLKELQRVTINISCGCTYVHRECTRFPNNRDISHCCSWQHQVPPWCPTINHSFSRRRPIPYSAQLQMSFQVSRLAYVINTWKLYSAKHLFLEYFIFVWGRRKSGRMLQSTDHFCLRKSTFVNAAFKATVKEFPLDTKWKYCPM